MNYRVRVNAPAVVDHVARKGLTFGQFAREAGLSEGSLSDYLAGKVSPKAASRAKLMQACGMDFDSLFRVGPVTQQP